MLRLKDKLGIVEIELKFKVPNLNIPPTEIHDDEDLQWYISVHKETALCVTILETEFPSVDMATDATVQGTFSTQRNVRKTYNMTRSIISTVCRTPKHPNLQLTV